MPTKSQRAKRHTSHVSPAQPPSLSSPIPELTGLKLFKHNLNRKFRNTMPSWFLWTFKEKQFIKSGDEVRVQEALTMDFIARTTTIPVPRLLDVFTIHGTVHIVQERIHGPVLEDIWRRLSPEERHSAMMQVKDCFEQLRALTPPHPERVEAVDGSSLQDSRVDRNVWGPFDNHDELHRFLNYDILREQSDTYDFLQEALEKVRGKKYRSVFTHGDFGPHNIMWRPKERTIVIIDWERSGWLPEYWDYTKAHLARWYMKSWWEPFKEVVDNYHDELELQILINSHFEMAY